MKISRVVHQQVFQLRWQLLACLGLIMVLPLEEAVMNLVEGEGFYSDTMSLAIFFIFPFLAGLITCANVQADLDEKRYIFWVSKPVGMISFIMLKYLVGLVLALFILACPVVFAVISNAMCETDGEFVKVISDTPALLIAVLVSLLTYSLCFLCNVLVRKTARAWLIGITATGFLLLIPFMLPLNFKDVATDIVRLASSIYVIVFLTVILVTFVVSLFAVRHNWHVQTNLKGLFWVAAGFMFVFMMIFSRQVANIKVLDEIKVEVPVFRRLSNIDGKITLHSNHGNYEDKCINIANNRIIVENPETPFVKYVKHNNDNTLYEIEEGLSYLTYPRFEEIFYKSDNNTYFFELYRYHYNERTEERRHGKRYINLYLHSNKILDRYSSKPVAALDLSDFIQNESFGYPAMRLIGDKLFVFEDKNFAVIKVKDTGELELLDKKNNAVKPNFSYGTDRKNIIKVPLIATDAISIEEQVKLTIDYYYGRQYKLHTQSIVDIYGDRISFAIVNNWDVASYDIVKWDDEFVYCKFRDARPFTYLEQLFRGIGKHDYYFVEDGKLYAYHDMKLIVFDIRSERIRKLGHFERMSEKFRIRDVEVLEDGNMLMNVSIETRPPEKKTSEQGGLFIYTYEEAYLYLLKNPE